MEHQYYGPCNKLLYYAFQEFMEEFGITPHKICVGDEGYEKEEGEEEYENDKPWAKRVVRSVYFVVYYEAHTVMGRMDRQKYPYGYPVLVLQVKPDDWAGEPMRRREADREMRRRFGELMPFVGEGGDGGGGVQRLWGVSLLGTGMRVYCCENEDASGKASEEGKKKEKAKEKEGSMEIDIDIKPPLVRRHSWDHALPSDSLEGEWGVELLSLKGLEEMQRIVGDIIEFSRKL